MTVADEREEKPKVDDKIQLAVCHQGRTVKFKVKRTTSLKKVLDEAAKRFNIERSELRFEYQGVTIRGNEGDTPEALGIEEDDVIDAHIQQLGGAVINGQLPCRDLQTR